MSQIKTATFQGGVHPLAAVHHGKPQTQDAPITPALAPEVAVFPLGQHIGAPADPIVKAGDTVCIGQKIGEAKGFVSAPVHASVSGKVTAVEPRMTLSGAQALCVVVQNDHEDTWDPGIAPRRDVDALTPADLIQIIGECGIVGLGGASFPTHVKLSPPPKTPVDTLLLNGAECEPYLTSDHRMMLEHPEKVAGGLRLLMKTLGVEKAIVGIENNKQNAIAALKPLVEGIPGAAVAPMRVKYPQGSEKQLIEALTGRQVPSGALPAAAGCVVVNVGTAVAVYDAVYNCRPIVDTLITVAGAVEKPSNLLARVGTPFADLIAQCGGLSQQAFKVISGGPMMGVALYDLSVPVQKSTSGILVLTEREGKPGPGTACIRCARCAVACPIFLQPMMLNRYSVLAKWDLAEKAGAMDCVECGACSFACPAKLDLTTNIRVAKRTILAMRKKN